MGVRTPRSSCSGLADPKRRPVRARVLLVHPVQVVPQVASHLLLVLRGLPDRQVANRRPQVLPGPQMGLLRVGRRRPAAQDL